MISAIRGAAIHDDRLLPRTPGAGTPCNRDAPGRHDRGPGTSLWIAADNLWIS